MNQKLLFSHPQEKIKKLLNEEYNIGGDDKSINSAINFLNLKFDSNDAEKFDNVSFFDNNFKITKSFKKNLDNSRYWDAICDLIDFALLKYKKEYNSKITGDNLALYQKYSRKDVCRILNWDTNEDSTVFGYKIKHGTCPIFVKYGAGKYDDEFLSKNELNWISRAKDNKNINKIINCDENNLKIHLFVMKSVKDIDSKENGKNKKSTGGKKYYFYMGCVKPSNKNLESIEKDGEISYKIKFKLDSPVDEELYSYFLEDI